MGEFLKTLQKAYSVTKEIFIITYQSWTVCKKWYKWNPAHYVKLKNTHNYTNLTQQRGRKEFLHEF